jgi:hypothetical protein
LVCTCLHKPVRRRRGRFVYSSDIAADIVECRVALE